MSSRSTSCRNADGRTRHRYRTTKLFPVIDCPTGHLLAGHHRPSGGTPLCSTLYRTSGLAGNEEAALGVFRVGTLTGEGVQGCFDFVATDAWCVGDEPYSRPRGPRTGAYSTSLTIALDDDPDRKAHRIPPGVSPEEYFRQQRASISHAAVGQDLMKCALITIWVAKREPFSCRSGPS